MTYQSINPNDGQCLMSFEHLSSARLDELLAAAEACFDTWRHKSYAERAAVLTKAAALLQAHVDDFARLEALEMGRRIAEARGEVKFSGDILGHHAQHAESLMTPAQLQPKVGEAHVESSPLGVLFCVEPWNADFGPAGSVWTRNEQAFGPWPRAGPYEHSGIRQQETRSQRQFRRAGLITKEVS